MVFAIDKFTRPMEFTMGIVRVAMCIATNSPWARLSMGSESITCHYNVYYY